MCNCNQLSEISLAVENFKPNFTQPIKIPNLTARAKEAKKSELHTKLKRHFTPAFSQSLHNSLLKYFVYFVVARIDNQMVHACWWYYFSKFTEFFDTVSLFCRLLQNNFSAFHFSQIFFVMRKKTSQVSTLHVIHHGVMPMSGKLLEAS